MIVKLITSGTTVSVFVLSIFLFGKKILLVEVLAVVIVGICLVVYQFEKRRLAEEMTEKVLHTSSRKDRNKNRHG